MSYARTPEGIAALVRDTLAAKQAITSGDYTDEQYADYTVAVINALGETIGLDDVEVPFDWESVLVDAIRAQLAKPEWQPETDGGTEPLFDYGPRPTHVLIETSEWDNGWFYENYGTVIYSDGSTANPDQLDLTGAEEAITEIASDNFPLGSQAGLLIDLATGTVDADDYISSTTDALIRRDTEPAESR